MITIFFIWGEEKLVSWQAGKLASWQAGKLASWRVGELVRCYESMLLFLEKSLLRNCCCMLIIN
jgi:hypothetical protein